MSGQPAALGDLHGNATFGSSRRVGRRDRRASDRGVRSNWGSWRLRRLGGPVLFAGLASTGRDKVRVRFGAMAPGKSGLDAPLL